MYCPKCGKKIDDNARFCGYCGTPQKSRPAGSSGGRPPQTRRSSSAPVPSSGYRRPQNTAPVRRKKTGSGKVILTVVLILVLIAVAAAAVVLILRKKPEKTGFLAQGQGNTTAESEAGSDDKKEDTVVPEADVPAETQESAASSSGSVLLDQADFSMTADGYSSFGTTGYQVHFTFVNRSSRDLCLGYNRPSVNGVANNTEGSFSIAAGQTFSGVINLNLAGICSPQDVQTISLPLFVYDDPGDAGPMPSTQQSSGSNYVNTTVTVTP